MAKTGPLPTAEIGDFAVPRHVAIIMDGNGRWAAARGLPRGEGHRRGVEALRRTVRAAGDLGIDFLTIFSFSAENWSRPPAEIRELMGLLRRFIRHDLADLHRRGVRVRVIGEREGLDPDIRRLLDEAEELTKDNSRLVLVVAFNYGARQEIARAARRMATAVAAGELAVSAVTADRLASYLDVPDLPDPDLIIRTSGEQRLSNFLLWQAAYSELALRICSALVLVPLAIGAAYIGGWPFALFWGIAAMGVLWEWTSLVARGNQRPVLGAGEAALALALALAVTGHLLAAVIVLAMGTLGAASLALAERRVWVAGGIPYAGALALAPIVLRSDGEDGFLAMIFLFAIVWTTDIGAYFVGRAIGGPKLVPQVSPNKTWAGALGGMAAAVVVAVAAAKAAALTNLFAIGMLAVVLSVCAQGGDLFESVLKRRFGAKDSSRLIPGHGGLMDRLDGFVTASVAAVLIGLARGGFEAPGRGLLVW